MILVQEVQESVSLCGVEVSSVNYCPSAAERKKKLGGSERVVLKEGRWWQVCFSIGPLTR